MAGPSQVGGPEGHVPPHFLADQLTLSQPGGGHIIPTQYYVPPQIFRPCDGPELLKHRAIGIGQGEGADYAQYYYPWIFRHSYGPEFIFNLRSWFGFHLSVV